MVEDYYIQMRTGRAYQTGTDCRGKKVFEYRETYKTSVGEFSPQEWRERIRNAIEQAGETEMLDIIKNHCREHCAWLHKEVEISDYAMDILAGRFFLCGNPAWKDVWDEIRKKYFFFIFAEESL